MFVRWKESRLREALATRRGVHLTGVRQCGKATLAEHLSGDTMRHLSLDLQELQEAAINDPMGFIGRSDGGTLISDEIPNVPAL